MFSKVVVVDARGHLAGRLASIVAKELLAGQNIVIVRAEEIERSGHIWRNEIKLRTIREKKTNTNHERGPFIHRSPADYLKRMIRGMVAHKTHRGTQALLRLKVFDGMPSIYARMQKKVIPEALRVLRLRPGRKFTNMGELLARNGWKYADVVKTLEEKRKVKAQSYFERKLANRALRQKATEEADIPADVKATLEQYGY